MIKQNNHIVARCSWDTTFDAKDKGVELQNKISNWSEHHMPKEINAVFNTICPYGQTLKIKTLALDLGTIDYDNLTEDLAIKLRTQLHLQLNDILMYPNKHGQRIEILGEESTNINVLRYFLLQGIMPWNYQEVKGTVHQIFEDQLVNNRQEVIHMIKTVAVEEYVRRRISWQFKETSIKRIIENIEKSNHNYIIAFSEEFIKIQEREAIVKSGIHDFKKNLWFWILNYLFVERGTMFNKIEFVKSNIQQMANHFNIEYHELFALIEDAVYKVHEHSYVKTDFILILSILSQKQSKTLKVASSSEKQLEKYWHALENYFKSPKNSTNSFQKKEIEALIYSLSKVSPTRFKNSLNTVQNNVSNWQCISKDLGIEAVKILLSTLSSFKGEKIYTEVVAVQKLALQKHFNLKETWVLAKSFQFLKKEETIAYSKTNFLDFLLSELASSKKTTQSKIVEKLINATITSDQKNIQTLGLFKHLKQLHEAVIIKNSPSFSEEKLLKLLKLLSKKTSIKTSIAVVESYYKTIRFWVKNNTVAVWRVLSNYKDKQSVQRLIPLIINTDEVIQVVLKKVYPKKYQLIKNFTKSINSANVDAEIYETLQKIQKHLVIESFGVIRFSERQHLKTFIQLLFANLKIKTTTENTKSFEKSMLFLLQNLRHKTTKDIVFSKETLQLVVHNVNNTTALQVVVNCIKQSNYKQYEVATILKNVVYEKKFKTQEFIKNQALISNYFLTDANSIKKEITEEYLKKEHFLAKKYTKTILESTITERFWMCIIAYSSYRGDTIKFKELLKLAVAAVLEAKVVSTINKNTNSVQEVNKLNTPTRILKTTNEQGVLDYLKEVLEQNKTEIKVKKQVISLATLFLFCLEEFPKETRALLQKLPFSKIVKKLQKEIVFSQFIALISKDKTSTRFNSIVLSIEALYNLTIQIGSEKSITTVEKQFWEYSFQLIQSKTNDIKILDELATTVLKELTTLADENLVAVLYVIKENNIQIPKVLKDILTKKNSTFELLATEAQHKPVSKELQNCYEEHTIAHLCESLLLETKIPVWFAYAKGTTVKALLKEIIQEYPLLILGVLRKNTISKTQLSKLLEEIDMEQFFRMLKKMYPREQNNLSAIQQLYQLLQKGLLKEMSAMVLQEVLLEKILKSWTNSNWKLIATTTIWKELLWEVSTKSNIKEKTFFKAIDSIEDQLPISLKITYERFNQHKKQSNNKYQKQIMTIEKQDLQGVGIPVSNAGMVLLNSYFTMLLDRLGLLTNDGFKSEECRLKAVHYMQYLVTGMTQTEESLLTLNKVLCGIIPSQPIQDRIVITAKEKELINGLLNAAINYWPAIGNTSINGFRGNWLVREGLLREEEDRWQLTVEKRAYDILLMKSPFSFSILKLPWMEKPLHVTWSY